MRKEYNNNLIFDNHIEDGSGEHSAFSLEFYIRNAAQRMIQAALELEVEEFLQRAKYDKTTPEEFRGYRNGHHRERTVSKRDLSQLKIVYVWADGIYLKAGMADERRCLLVIIGVDMTGRKHLLMLREGFRESAESWSEAMMDLKKRGLNEPALAIADGGLGFWAALPRSVESDQSATLLVA